MLELILLKLHVSYSFVFHTVIFKENAKPSLLMLQEGRNETDNRNLTYYRILIGAPRGGPIFTVVS